MNIPQAAIEAAAEEHRAQHFPDVPSYGPMDRWEEATKPILEAAMPHLRRQVARDIRAEMVGRNWNKTFLNGLEYGAYIAEKGLTK